MSGEPEVWPTAADYPDLNDEQLAAWGVGFVTARCAAVLTAVTRLGEAPAQRRALYIRTITETLDRARDELLVFRRGCVHELHVQLGWSYAQIAEVLGVSRSRVAQLDAETGELTS